MGELDVGEFFSMQSDNFFTPYHTGLKHIGLVHRTDLVPASTRQFERRLRHAANLVGGVLLGIETAPLPIGERLDAARLAEIDAAGQFANDVKVDAFQHMCL